MRVVVLAPIDNSLYSLLVAHRCLQEPGVELCGIVLRRVFSHQRVKSEYRREGVRLLKKVWLKGILGNQRDDRLGEEDSLTALAQSLGLEVRSLVKLAHRRQILLARVGEINGPRAVSFLEKIRPDLVLFTGGEIIRQPILERSGMGVFNLHMGILPSYRGMDVLEWTILEGRHTDIGLGLTLHFMDRGVDTGDILLQRKVNLRKGDTLEGIRRRLEVAMVDLMMQGVRAARDGKLNPIPQRQEEGKQFFVMHPRLRKAARDKLTEILSGHEPRESHLLRNKSVGVSVSG